MIEKLKKIILKIVSYSLPIRDKHINIIFWISAGLIGILGIVLRLRQYLANRSLWLDEAALAINIKEKSFYELLQPLEFNQIAPIGFLFLEKIAVLIGGTNELSLRFFPLLAGILCFPFSLLLYKKLIGRLGALIGLWLIVSNWILIYYSNEVKQYSFDVLALVSIFYIYLIYSKNYSEKKRIILLAVAGTLWVWFSSVSIIILLSVLIFEAVVIIKLTNLERLKNFTIIALFWGISFMFYYIIFIYQHPAMANMKYYWAQYFIPTSSSEISFTWIKEEFYHLFDQFLWFGTRANLVLMALAIGLLLSFLLKRSLLLMGLPILISLLLSALTIYPFHDRLILFLVPAFFGFIAYGIALSFEKFNRKIIRFVLVIFLFMYLTKYPHRWTKSFYRDPPLREHIRPAFDLISNNLKSDDTIYVFAGTINPFQFYKDIYFTNHHQIIDGPYSDSKREEFINQFISMRGRVWIPLSHMTPVDGISFIEDWVKKHPDQVVNTYVFSDKWGINSKTFLIDKK